MPRHARYENKRRRGRKDLAPKLIGAGLLLVVLPLLLGKSPVAAAFKPMAPFGWLMLLAGCGLLWWQLRGGQSKPGRAPIVERSELSTPPRRTPAGAPLGARERLEPVQLASPDQPPATQAPSVPQAWGPAVFDAIEWRRFEALVEALFAQAGFETKSQSHGADEGIDIWLYSGSNPGTPASLVQCKHWQGKRVGVDKVRELRGVMAAKGVSRGQFATTSTFTDDAIAFAKENGINLLDVKALLALIATRTDEQRQALLAVALEGDYGRPTCVNCGTKMVERQPRKAGALFWGCSGYPRCKTSLPMRQAASAGK